MNRRRFFLQSSALLTAGWLSRSAAAGSAKNAPAPTVCGFDKRRHSNLCTVRLTGPLQYAPARKGGNDAHGCWLACLQMVFGYYGHTVSAQSIAHEVYGSGLPRQPWQDLAPLSRSLVDEKGHHFTVITEKMPVRAADAAEILAENQPLIIGAFGHPVLLTAMSYTGDRLGGMTIVDATVLDPSPGKGTRIVSSPEWINVSFIARVAVRKAGSKT